MTKPPYPALQALKITDLERQWHKPRVVDQSTLLAVQLSVDALGLLSPPTVNVRTMRMLNGHAVAEALLAAGQIKMPCWVVDLAPEQEWAAFFALNNHGNDWDWNKVSDKLKELKAAGVNLTTTGFCPAKIKALTHCGDWTPPEPPKLGGESALQSEWGF